MGPLMGTNKATWDVKLLLTTVSSYQVDWRFLCPTEDIALLFASLWSVVILRKCKEIDQCPHVISTFGLVLVISPDYVAWS